MHDVRSASSTCRHGKSGHYEWHTDTIVSGTIVVKCAPSKDGRRRKKHFGKQVKKLRVACGISQEELAHLADIHTSYVSQLERGVKSPSFGVILRVALALGTSGSELIRGVEESMAAQPC